MLYDNEVLSIRHLRKALNVIGKHQMTTPKEKFNLYYRPWLIAYIIIFGLKIISEAFGKNRATVLSIKGLLIFIGAVSALTLFVGGLYHFFYEYVRPRRRNKLLNKKVLYKLEELGFKKDLENMCYGGHFRNYYLNIMTDSDLEEGDNLRINAFIDYTENQIETVDNLAKIYEFNDGDLAFFTHKIKLPFGLIPNIETIKTGIEKLVEDLKKMDSNLQ